MEWTTLLLLCIGFICGLIIGWIWTSIKHRMKAPWAGNIIVDMRRECDDTIRIESPRNIGKWNKYKQLTFDVVVEFDKPTRLKDFRSKDEQKVR